MQPAAVNFCHCSDMVPRGCDSQNTCQHINLRSCPIMPISSTALIRSLLSWRVCLNRSRLSADRNASCIIDQDRTRLNSIQCFYSHDQSCDGGLNLGKGYTFLENPARLTILLRSVPKNQNMPATSGTSTGITGLELSGLLLLLLRVVER